MDPEILDRAKKIELLLLDVDGVLTDGHLILSNEGAELKSFHARDGLGFRMAQRGGLMIGLVSGRESKVVIDRAEELYITEVHQRVYDKLEKFREILQRLKLKPEQVCFMGDDLVDMQVMRAVGFAAAPADAIKQVRAIAHYVASRDGGAGCVRELVDILLQATGKWDKVTSRFLE